MVETRPLLDFLTHLVLIIGVVIVAFPVYVAFIASTHGTGAFVSGVMPLLPGSHMVENYSLMWNTGLTSSCPPPLWGMMFTSLWMALFLAVGKCSIPIT